VIAVGVHDPVCSVDQAQEAIYGSARVTINPADWSVTPGTAPDGFFSPSSQFPEGKNRRVADVYLLLPWRPWEPEAARFLRTPNPFADRPLEDDVLPVAATFGVIKEEPGQLVLGWNPERGWF
jgi:hypothetical protein